MKSTSILKHFGLFLSRVLLAIMCFFSFCESQAAGDPIQFVVNGLTYRTDVLEANSSRAIHPINEANIVRVYYQSNYKNTLSGTVTIPDEVTYNGITYKVVELGDNCFSECSSISRIVLGYNIRYICYGALGGTTGACKQLRSIVSCCEMMPTYNISEYEKQNKPYSNVVVEVPMQQYSEYNSNSNWKNHFTLKSVSFPVTSVELSRYNATMITDGKFEVSAIIQPALADNKTLTWTSSNTNVASIQKTNNEIITVTAEGIGISTITATAANGLSASCIVVVKSTQTKNIGSGTLTSDVLPANCNTTGNRTQFILSKSEVSATPINIFGLTFQCASYAQDVQVVNGELSVYFGSKSSTSYSSATDYVPSSSLYNAGGMEYLYMGESKGWEEMVHFREPYFFDASSNLVVQANIDIDKEDRSTGVTHYCTKMSSNSTIYNLESSTKRTLTNLRPNVQLCYAAITKVSSISITGSKNIDVDTRIQLKATCSPYTADNQSITWSSSNPAVADVCKNTGIVTGVSKGSATITAMANDGSGVKATYNVSVVSSHILTKHAAQTPTCTTSGNKEYWSCSHCSLLFANAEATVTTTMAEVSIPATGHSYGTTPSWTWNGYTSATATLTCTRDASHTISATATGSSITTTITKAATCTTSGTRTYTAKVTLDGNTYQGKKTQTISATGHGKTNGYTPTFLWEDNATSPSCTFSLRCMDCNTYVVSSQSLPKGTSGTYGYYLQTAHSDPTCSVSGSTTYRATGKYSASGSQSYTGTNDHTYSISATDNHTYDSNGFCSSCDAYQPATIDTDGYYKIANAGNLYWFAEQVNSGAGTINGKLIADIIVNTNVLKSDGTLNTGDYRNWAPIGMLVGVQARFFQGIFDGYSHSISGLYFNDYTNDYAGIFGQASNASIRNLIVRDSYFLSKYAAGGIVASAYDCDISNCVNYSTAGAPLAGGILGVNRNYNVMNIQKCSNYGYIFDTDEFCSIGGICGYLEAYEDNSFLRKCSNFGKVKASYSKSYSGGIVGYIGADDGTAYVEYCYNVGSVSGSHAGAIVGYHYHYVNYCLALLGSASAIAGELAHYAYSTGNSFISSFSTGEACYLLNESKDSGTNWYQNLDNGKGIDSYPVTDTSHGQVYAGYAHGGTSVSYSNSSMTVKHTTAATASNYKHDNDYTMTATWTGYTACSIKEVCSVCSKTVTQSANITNAVTKSPTCTTSGNRTHTAKVTTAGGRVYTTTRTETIPAPGHSYKYTNNMNGTHKKECSYGDFTATNESHSATSNCSLCGNKPVTNINMSHAVDTLAIGQTRTLTATVAPNDATIKTITWSSNATNVATVTSNGVVTAKAAGSATITAAASDQSGKKTTCVYQIYILGDANANGSVNVADVTTIAGYKNWKAKTITTRSVSFVFAAANANFTDQVIDVADITSTVSIVWNGVSYEARPRLSGAQSFEPTILYADGFTLAPGHAVDVDILVSNPSDCFSAYEFFLDLPDGIRVKSDLDGNAMIRLNTARTNGEAVHAFSGRYTEDGRLYVLCYSASNTMFQGQSGAVATVTLEADPTVMTGSYHMSLSNIVLSGEGDVINPEDQMIGFDIASQNGIELLYDEYESSCWVFDLQGRVVKVDGRPAVSLELLPEGTYIINGKKVIK